MELTFTSAETEIISKSISSRLIDLNSYNFTGSLKKKHPDRYSYVLNLVESNKPTNYNKSQKLAIISCMNEQLSTISLEMTEEKEILKGVLRKCGYNTKSN